MSQRELNSLQAATFGYEHDTEALVVQCGEQRQVFGMPIQFAHRRNRYEGLSSRVMAAAWGQHPPDLNVIDAAAERDGQEFAAIARKWTYESYDPFEAFRFSLQGYQGPIGKAAHDWRIETGTGLRLLRFVEPQGYELGVGPSDVFSLRFRLTLDRRSGKVLESKPLVDSNSEPKSRPVWAASLRWVFDPSTIPEDPVVNVTVNFHANCGGQD